MALKYLRCPWTALDIDADLDEQVRVLLCELTNSCAGIYTVLQVNGLPFCDECTVNGSGSFLESALCFLRKSLQILYHHVATGDCFLHRLVRVAVTHACLLALIKLLP